MCPLSMSGFVTTGSPSSYDVYVGRLVVAEKFYCLPYLCHREAFIWLLGPTPQHDLVGLIRADARTFEQLPTLYLMDYLRRRSKRSDLHRWASNVTDEQLS